MQENMKQSKTSLLGNVLYTSDAPHINLHEKSYSDIAWPFLCPKKPLSSPCIEEMNHSCCNKKDSLSLVTANKYDLLLIDSFIKFSNCTGYVNYCKLMTILQHIAILHFLCLSSRDSKQFKIIINIYLWSSTFLWESAFKKKITRYYLLDNSQNLSKITAN